MHTYVDFAVFLWTVIYKPMINVLRICFSVALSGRKRLLLCIHSVYLLLAEVDLIWG